MRRASSNAQVAAAVTSRNVDESVVPSVSTEQDIIAALNFRNTSMTLILTHRLHALQEIRSIWDESNIKPAVMKLAECSDHAVWVDMLKLMNSRAKLFTLDVAILLLPLVNELLFEVYEELGAKFNSLSFDS
ncbi:hypothetical protein HDU83_000186 [Entophlyctis luteolus]|nr:hypothetical protein HDU83_000186 [Entophlyctis luteolus]